jgi:DNA gyrase subunit A
MYVVKEGGDLLVATGGGYAKRTPVDADPVQGRGGRGVVTAKVVEARGELIGALMVHDGDEIFAITSAGGVIRTNSNGVKQSGRQTMGVRLMNLASGDSVVGLALNAESAVEAESLGAESLGDEPLDDGAEAPDQDISGDIAGLADEEEPGAADSENPADAAGEDDDAEE